MSKSGELCLKHFSGELSQIGNPELKDFVVQCFDELCPDYFWHRAASSSGRYHPAFVKGDGGLVRHTKYVAKLAADFARSRLAGQEIGTPGSCNYPDKSPYEDHVVAAALIHDMMKDGDLEKDALRGIKRLDDGSPNMKDPATKKAYYEIVLGGHGIDVAEAIFHRIYNSDGSAIPRAQMIVMYAAATHMGIWTNQPEYRPANIQDPETRCVCEVVHDADYMASRKIDGYIEHLSKYKV